MTSIDSGFLFPQRGRITVDDGGHRHDYVNDGQCYNSSDRVLSTDLLIFGSVLSVDIRVAICDYVNIGQTLDPKRRGSLAAAAWCMARDRTGCAGNTMLSAHLQ